MTSETQPTVAQPDPRPGSRRTRRQVAKPAAAPPKIKTAINLSPDSFRRLGVHCAVERRTQSDLLEELIEMHLRRYPIPRPVSDRAVEAESACPVESAA